MSYTLLKQRGRHTTAQNEFIAQDTTDLTAIEAQFGDIVYLITPRLYKIYNGSSWSPYLPENITTTEAAIKAAIETNLGRLIPEGTPFIEYVGYILPPVEWRPDPLWPSLTDIADGQIGMIVRDRDDLGVAARCAFTVTATAAYVVDWGDGTAPETVASTVMADHTYTLGAGTPDSKGTTTFKVRISSTGTITRILMASNVTTGNVKQTVQNVEIKAGGIVYLDTAFQFCGMLQHVGDMNLASCVSANSTFLYCSCLISVGSIVMQNCASAASMFNGCLSLRSIGDLNLPKCVSATSALYFCGNLISVGSVNLPLCTSVATLFYACVSLQTIGDMSGIGSAATSVDCDSMFFRVPYSGIINLANAKLTKILSYGAGDRYSGITGLTFHPSSTFSGSAPQINVSYTMMDRTALVALFNLLPTLVGKTINITGCIGTADLTADDRAIATGKGWSIMG